MEFAESLSGGWYKQKMTRLNNSGFTIS